MAEPEQIKCPHCSNSDERLIEWLVSTVLFDIYTCAVCSKSFQIKK